MKLKIFFLLLTIYSHSISSFIKQPTLTSIACDNIKANEYEVPYRLLLASNGAKRIYSTRQEYLKEDPNYLKISRDAILSAASIIAALYYPTGGNTKNYIHLFSRNIRIGIGIASTIASIDSCINDITNAPIEKPLRTLITAFPTIRIGFHLSG